MNDIRNAARRILIDGDEGVGAASRFIGTDNAAHMLSTFLAHHMTLMAMCGGSSEPTEDAISELVRLYENDPAD